MVKTGLEHMYNRDVYEYLKELQDDARLSLITPQELKTEQLNIQEAYPRFYAAIQHSLMVLP